MAVVDEGRFGKTAWRLSFFKMRIRSIGMAMLESNLLMKSLKSRRIIMETNWTYNIEM